MKSLIHRSSKKGDLFFSQKQGDLSKASGEKKTVSSADRTRRTMSASGSAKANVSTISFR